MLNILIDSDAAISGRRKEECGYFLEWMGVHLLLNKTNVVVCLSVDHTCVHVDVYHRFEGKIVGFDESGSPFKVWMHH